MNDAAANGLRPTLNVRAVWPSSACTVGWVMALAGMFLHVSTSSQAIMGRWSVEYAVFLLLVSAVATAPVLAVVLRQRKSPGQPCVEVEIASVAILLWGFSYLITALGDRSSAARVLGGNLFGSIHPVGAFLEWCVLAMLATATTAYLWRRMELRWREPLLLIGSVLASVLVLELGARAKAHIYPTPTGFPSYSGQLWHLRHAKLDEEGFRPNDGPTSADHGILVVGDSYAFGTGIEQVTDRFGERLASLLEEEPGGVWAVTNASRGDTNTLHHIDFLRRKLGTSYDLVILEYVFNDIDYLRPVTPRVGFTEAPSGVFGRLSPGRVAFVNFYLFQEIFARIRHLWVQWQEVSPPSLDAYADAHVLQTHIGDLKAFVTLAQTGGAKVVLVPFDIAVLESAAFAERYERFVAALEDEGLPYCSLRNAFSGSEFSDLTVNRLDAHPNEAANEIAARHVSPCIRSLLAD